MIHHRIMHSVLVTSTGERAGLLAEDDTVMIDCGFVSDDNVVVITQSQKIFVTE